MVFRKEKLLKKQIYHILSGRLIMEKTNEKKDFIQKTWVVCVLALVCTFLWGSASPCIKLGYALFKIPSSETWTQVLFAGTRFVLAGVLTILI